MTSHCTPTSRAHQMLVRRLTDRHGLHLLRAQFAVRRVALGIPDEHTDLVHTEANALLTELTAAVTTHLGALVHAFDGIGRAAQQSATAFEPRAVHHARRPAWQSPYGPARNRRGGSR